MKRSPSRILPLLFLMIFLFTLAAANVAAAQTVAVPKTENPYAGKRFSVLSDSISAYTDVSVPAVPGTYPDQDPMQPYAPGSITSPDQMWWSVLAAETGMQLLKVAAQSGIKVGRMANTLDYSRQLHDGAIEPDVIIVSLYGNDANEGTPLGTFNGIGQLPNIESSPGTFREAYAVALMRVKTRYPNAEVWCALLPTGILGWPAGSMINYYENSIRQIATAFGCKIIEWGQSGLTWSNLGDMTIWDRIHPNAEAQRLMGEHAARQILSGLSTVGVPGFDVSNESNVVFASESGAVLLLKEEENWVQGIRVIPHADEFCEFIFVCYDQGGLRIVKGVRGFGEIHASHMDEYDGALYSLVLRFSIVGTDVSIKTNGMYQVGGPFLGSTSIVAVYGTTPIGAMTP